MKSFLNFKETKKWFFSFGAACVIVFADLDPTIPPPEYKEVMVLEEESGDDKDKNDTTNKKEFY